MGFGSFALRLRNDIHIRKHWQHLSWRLHTEICVAFNLASVWGLLDLGRPRWLHHRKHFMSCVHHSWEQLMDLGWRSDARVLRRARLGQSSVCYNTSLNIVKGVGIERWAANQHDLALVYSSDEVPGCPRFRLSFYLVLDRSYHIFTLPLSTVGDLIR